MGPLRWDHQKSDEFEATFRLLGRFSLGDESNLKFARLLATGYFHLKEPCHQSKNITDSLTSTYRGLTLFKAEFLKVIIDLQLRRRK